MKEAAIVATARTPVGKAHRGALNNLHGATLAAHSISAAVERAGLEPGEIADVLLGSARCEGAVGSNIARQAALRAGLPISVCGMTLDRKCSSGPQTIAIAAQRIRSGEGGIYVAGGVETVSLVDPHRNTFRSRDDWLVEHRPEIYMAMNLTGDLVARRYGISREAQDQFAWISQARTAAAQDSGWFDAEIAPITATKNLVDKALAVTGQAEAAVRRRYGDRGQLQSAVRRVERVRGDGCRRGSAARDSDPWPLPRNGGRRLRARGDGHRSGGRGTPAA